MARILMVDDDPHSMSAAVEFLQRGNPSHEVVLVGSERDAVQRIQAGDDPIHAVVTDTILAGDIRAGHRVAAAARTTGIPAIAFSVASDLLSNPEQFDAVLPKTGKGALATLEAKINALASPAIGASR